MSLSTRTAFAELRHRPARFVGVLLAIIIGTAFATATAVFSATASRAIEVAVAQDLQNTDVLVTPGEGASVDSSSDGMTTLRDKIATGDHVEAVAPLVTAFYHVPGSTSLTGVPVSGVVEDEQLSYGQLSSGSWPTKPGEIALDPTIAKENNVGIGDEIVLEDDLDRKPVSFTITGITKPNPDLVNLTGPTSWASPDFLADEPGAWVGGFLVRTSGDVQETIDSLASVLPDGYSAVTGDEARKAAVDQVAGGTVAITSVLGTFAAIALGIAAIVIANTFTIVLAQRRRQIALQRLIGATGSQMKRQVVIEAAVIGVVGTALGIATGIAIGFFGASGFGAIAGGLVVPPVGLAVVALAGIVTTVLAAYLPIRRACQVPPIDALRPVDTQSDRVGASRWRLVGGIVTTLAGLAILGLGAYDHQLLIATLGGAVITVGVLMLAQPIVTALARVLRPVGAIGGVPGRIAARDVTRHSKRATSTAIALMIGVGLIVMIRVGASVTTATASERISDRVEAAQLETIMGVLTDVATGLLAVAAVIAVVGVANTLALSVIERRRESALMRALGVQRGQLRTMVSIEALILALIGSIVGMLAGAGLGIAAAYTIIGTKGLVLAMPWTALGIVFGITLVGALLASVLPAIRAGRVSPVAALAAT